MGRPIGSLNREKPFKLQLQLALKGRPESLRRIANRLIDAAETGHLPSILALVDRLDGRPMQAVDRHEVLIVDQLSDEELLLIASGGRTEVTDAELVAIASGGRIEDEMKLIPPMPPKDSA